MIRDTVEIVAILAAGIWAFYVFIYENRIVPSQAQPEVNFSASLQKVSEHNGLIGVRLDTEIKNIGTVEAHFVGVATAVVAQRIDPLSSPRPIVVKDNQVYSPRYYRASAFVPAYEYGYVTKLGDPRFTHDLPLDPGNDSRSETVFYVPAGRFDRLQVFMIGLYTRYDDKTIPTRLFVDADGLPKFSKHPDNVEEFSTFVTSLDLNGR